jgi:hypothetical protein
MTSMSTLLYWAPRVLGLLYAGFLGLFALDAFAGAQPLRDTLYAFLIHLAPAAAALLIMSIAWRYEVAGALLFAAAGVGYAIVARNHPSWIGVIAGPLFLIAALFAVSAARRAVPAGPLPRR